MTDATVSERLADWIVGFDPARVPEAAVAGCADTILDTVGLTVAALETDYGRAVRAAFPDTGTATVWGLAEGRAPEAAAGDQWHLRPWRGLRQHLRRLPRA
jgi:2-methylcitrate dehydratase PrpD